MKIKEAELSPGLVLGKLTLLQKIPSRKTGKSWKSFWRCQCECGIVKEIQSSNLARGNSKSCGCWRKDQPMSYNKKESGLANAKMAFTGYRLGAIKRNLSFEINLEDFLEMSSKNCFYCGIKPSTVFEAKYARGDKKGLPRLNGAFIYNGIDRINNDVGYTILNCVPCCSQCNISKLNLSFDEFVSWIERVYYHLLS
jgi:hypothetical protein